MREWTERHIRELIKNEIKNTNIGGGGSGDYPGMATPLFLASPRRNFTYYPITAREIGFISEDEPCASNSIPAYGLGNLVVLDAFGNRKLCERPILFPLENYFKDNDLTAVPKLTSCQMSVISLDFELPQYVYFPDIDIIFTGSPAYSLSTKISIENSEILLNGVVDDGGNKSVLIHGLKGEADSVITLHFTTQEEKYGASASISFTNIHLYSTDFDLDMREWKDGARVAINSKYYGTFDVYAWDQTFQYPYTGHEDLAIPVTFKNTKLLPI